MCAASADRRPVDPPPIVELKIYEGDGPDSELKDVTFSMNCNYFLFATLEQARHISRGRVPPDQRTPTVLTGTSVAGMVYLDRPSKAGYFIFPDLSVRHEGQYRLSFNLYEEIKEAKDEDRGENAKLSGFSNGSVTHRLDVSSEVFTVFSAKKFPGLTESTALSRVVAEQGCRVRIRRDVRMRRRDNKSSKDWDGYEDETSELRARVSATPEATAYPGYTHIDPIQRPRSGSNASHISLAPSLSRRTSLQDINQGYHSSSYGPTAPHTPRDTYPQSSPYIAGPSPTHAYGPPAFVQQQSTMQPPPPSYHQHAHPPAPPLPHAAPSYQSHYGYTSVSSPAFDGSISSHRNSTEYSPLVAPDHRRSAHLYGPPPQVLPPPSLAQPQGSYQSQAGAPAYQQSSSYYSTYSTQHSSQSSFGTASAYDTKPAPAEPVQPPTRTSGAHTPSRAFNDKLPPIATSFNVSMGKAIEPASPGPAPASHWNTTQLAESSKRRFSNVFNDRHLSRPLRQGARPSPSGYNSTTIEAVYSADEDPLQDSDLDRNLFMVYRRADGRQVNRTLPPQE